MPPRVKSGSYVSLTDMFRDIIEATKATDQPVFQKEGS